MKFLHFLLYSLGALALLLSWIHATSGMKRQRRQVTRSLRELRIRRQLRRAARRSEILRRAQYASREERESGKGSRKDGWSGVPPSPSHHDSLPPFFRGASRR